MIPLRRQTPTATATTEPTAPTAPAGPAAASPAGGLAARVTGLVAGLALALVWVAPAAHGDGDHPLPAATDSASLHEVVDDREADVAQAQDAVTGAARIASDALERYTLAVRSLDAAHAAEAARQDELEAAQARLTEARASLGRWARSAYAGGGSYSPGYGLATVLTSRATDDLGSTVATLRRVGASRSNAIDAVEAAERDHARAADAAAASAHAAEALAVEASKARTVADAALAEQREVLAASEAALTQAQDAATRAAQREQALAAAAAANADGNHVTGPVGDCRGGDVGHYPNGLIPLTALCPLSAQPGQHLRADAAMAFDRMSRAYAAQFGTPICVTDSYRTYHEQIRLKIQKPHLAAVPGTSNHGWGTATDLCGGVQSFGTPQHEWLAANAPLYNWFLPSWARPGGSKPEPWHFEFAG